jgi:hypothetical protein
MSRDEVGECWGKRATSKEADANREEHIKSMPWKQPTVVSSRLWIRCNYHTFERSIVVKTAVGKEIYVAYSGMSAGRGVVMAEFN